MNEEDKRILETAIEYQRILPTLSSGEALYMAKKAHQDCNPSGPTNNNISITHKDIDFLVATIDNCIKHLEYKNTTSALYALKIMRENIKENLRV